MRSILRGLLRRPTRLRLSRVLSRAIALIVCGVTIASQVAADAMRRVVMIGDSITAGAMSGPEDGPSYTELVSKWLGADWDVLTEGCGLSDSRDWRPDSAYFYQPAGACRDRPVYWLYETHLIQPRNLPADVVTLLLGTNDANSAVQLNEPILPDAYEENLRTTIDALLLDGAKRIVLLSPPELPMQFNTPIRRAPWYTHRDLIGMYDQRIASICEDDARVVCGPRLSQILTLEQHFDPLPGRFALDVHPNAQGHAVIAEHLYETLSRVPEPGPDLLWLGSLVTLLALRRHHGVRRTSANGSRGGRRQRASRESSPNPGSGLQHGPENTFQAAPRARPCTARLRADAAALRYCRGRPAHRRSAATRRRQELQAGRIHARLSREDGPDRLSLLA